MDHTDTPQTGTQTDTNTRQADAPDTLEHLAQLAERAASNPHVAEPLRELIPLLVAVVRQHAEVLVLLGAA